MGTPTRYPDGVTNVGPGESLQSYLSTDPSRMHVWFNDFDQYTAAEWTVTETQAGATQAITNADGGILALVNSAADDDLNAIQWTKETYLMATAKQFWLKSRFKVSDATQSDLVVGIQITDATPLAVSDGFFWRKDDGSTTLKFIVVKNGTETATTVATMADDTYIQVAAHYDPNSSLIYLYANDVRVASCAITNFCDDEELAFSIAVQNGEAAAKTLSTDYLLVSKER